MKSVLPKIIYGLSIAVLTGFSVTTLAAEAPTTSTYEAPATQGREAKFSINAEPIWLILGGFGAKFEYFISDTVSIGLGGILIPSHRINSTTTSDGSISDISYNWEQSEAFLGSNIMLTGTLATRGLYINPAIGYQSTKLTDFGSERLSAELSTPAARFTVGYQWVLVDHLRLAAGGGLTVVSSSDIVVKDSSGNQLLSEKSSSFGGLALDLQVGYVF